VDSFLTITRRSEGIYKEKGSKFLAFAIPVSDVEEVKAIVAAFRKEYYDARHVCYAYMLGADREEFRANDDGEPSGTAGRPILGQINSAGLTDILILVVRYFGGVLLGTGGLVTAYKSAAADAIANNELGSKSGVRHCLPHESSCQESNLPILRTKAPQDRNAHYTRLIL